MPTLHLVVRRLSMTLISRPQVELQDVYAGKKGILVGVPGAFTPGEWRDGHRIWLDGL